MQKKIVKKNTIQNIFNIWMGYILKCSKLSRLKQNATERQDILNSLRAIMDTRSRLIRKKWGVEREMCVAILGQILCKDGMSVRGSGEWNEPGH